MYAREIYCRLRSGRVMSWRLMTRQSKATFGSSEAVVPRTAYRVIKDLSVHRASIEQDRHRRDERHAVISERPARTV